MERLASRQHLGRIIESLEKTGALEPLSCVNVALQILRAVCTDCLDCVKSMYSRSSFNVKLGHINLMPHGLIPVFGRCHIKYPSLYV